MCTLKTWNKFGKPGKKFEKMSGNPENSFTVSFQRCFTTEHSFFLNLNF